MSMEKFLLKDSAGNKSTTVTVFILGAMIVNLKLIFSGMTIGGLTLAEFSGTEYAAALMALGGIYVLRRTTGPTLAAKKIPNEEGE